MTNEAALVAKNVQEKLNGHTPHTRRCRVLSDEIVQQQGNGWWYVPVSIHRDQEHMQKIYESFSDIEDSLRDAGIEVLIVPRIIPFERWAETV